MQKRILVVDDDTMNLMRTKMILEKQYEVVLAESGERALYLLRNEKIDLVLLDIAMPEMNAIRLGAVNYLKKPFQPKELLKRVAKEFEE